MKVSFLKKLSGDVLYGILGLVFLNAVLQLFFYPEVIGRLGRRESDLFVQVTALAGLFAAAFGSGSNYARMRRSIEGKTENGDYLLFHLLTLLIMLPASMVVLPREDWGGGGVFLLTGFFFFSVLRYYGDVAYRLSVNFRRFFFYYLATGCGYLLGFFVLLWTKNYMAALLTGEASAFVYSLCTEKIYRSPAMRRSKDWTLSLKISLQLSFAYFMTDFVSYIDRLLIPQFGKPGDNTIYYVATVPGKILSLLTTPLNGVLMGHLSKYEGNLPKKIFRKLLLLVLLLCIPGTLASVGVAFIFLKIFYPKLTGIPMEVLFFGNAAQVLFFLGNILLVVLLRFASEKYQLYVGLFYGIAFFAISLPVLAFLGLQAFAMSLFFVNLLKLGMIWLFAERSLPS